MTYEPIYEGQLARLPLIDKDDNVVGHALVDAEDAPRLCGKPWRLGARGRPIRSERVNGRRVTVYLSRAVLGLPHNDGPRVVYADGDPLNARKSNLLLPQSWVLRQVHSDPLVSSVLLRLASREVAA